MGRLYIQVRALRGFVAGLERVLEGEVLLWVVNVFPWVVRVHLRLRVWRRSSPFSYAVSLTLSDLVCVRGLEAAFSCLFRRSVTTVLIGKRFLKFLKQIKSVARYVSNRGDRAWSMAMLYVSARSKRSSILAV